MQFQRGAIAHHDVIDDRRRRGDQIEVVLTAQAFLNDFEVEQAEEAAAEAEAERSAGFHFEAEAGVVQAQARDGFAQFFEIGGIGGEQAAEHDRLHFLEAGQGFVGRAFRVGDGVAHAGLRHFLDLRGDEADFAGAEFRKLLDLGAEGADTVHQVDGVRRHELDLLALLDDAIDNAHQHDDAEIGIVPAIDQHGLQRLGGIALGRRDAFDDGFKDFDDANAGFGAGQHGARCVEADNVLDLLLHLFRIGGGQIDLVDHRHDFMIMLDALIDVGQRLRFDALGCVHHQQRAFAGGEGARDFIGEIDVAGRVHQVEDIILPVGRAVIQAHGLRLDGDTALLLDIHVVEHLLRHLAQLQPAGRLDQAIGQRGFPMIDMGDDREIADTALVDSHASGFSRRGGACNATVGLGGGQAQAA